LFFFYITLPFQTLEAGRANGNSKHGYFFQWPKHFSDILAAKSGLIQKGYHFSQFIAAIMIDVTVIVREIKMTVGKCYNQCPIRLGHSCDFHQSFFVIFKVLENLGGNDMRKIMIIKGQIHGIGNYILPLSMYLLQHVKS
jgi:hypothetical protein